MIWIWFGLDGTGIASSADFHPILGPLLMIAFAFLGNTLFLTILVSMLSNTFSVIVANVVPEIQYRRTVLTFEGVKSDAIFAYMPPFNILALFVMLPLKAVLSARHFHKLNVLFTRVLNAPVLLFLSWYERRNLWVVDRHRRRSPPKAINWREPGGPRVAGIGWWGKTMQLWDVSRFSVHGDLQAVFDHEPPQAVLDAIADLDDLDAAPEGFGKALLDDLNAQFPEADGVRRRKRSSTFPDHFDLQQSHPPGSGQTPDRQQNKGQATSAAERAPPSPKAPPRPDSPPSAAPPKPAEVQRAQSDRLRREFADSGDESEDGEGHSRHPLRKVKSRAQRKDSIVDYGDDGGSSAVVMHEASLRLYNLEQGLRRVEGLLVRLVGRIDGIDGIGDDGERGNERERRRGGVGGAGAGGEGMLERLAEVVREPEELVEDDGGGDESGDSGGGEGEREREREISTGILE